MSKPDRPHTTAFILARAGSKGLPGKNIMPFLGKPLITWSIEHGLVCPDVTDVIVSTDSDDIADISRQAGARVMMRPDALATDTAMPKDAMRHHLKELSKENINPDIVVLLQPTSPLRQPQDITACVSAITVEHYDSAATFVKSPSSPYRAWLDAEHGPEPFVQDYDPWLPRQKLPTTYSLSGAVYAVRTDVFLADASHSFLPAKCKIVTIPPERSIDIDTALDLKIAETVGCWLEIAPSNNTTSQGG